MRNTLYARLLFAGLTILFSLDFTCMAIAAPAATSTAPDAAAIAVRAQNAFGLRLLRLLEQSERGQNVLISPLSIWQAGAMTQNGAGGAAKAGLRKALNIHADTTDGQLNTSTRALNDLLGAQTGVTLSVANSIWTTTGVPLRPLFMQTCRDFFNARAQSLNLSSPAAIQTINAWVSGKTGGKIPNLLNDGDLDGADVALVNAVFFHGDWESPFDPEGTTDFDFLRADGIHKKVRMMRAVDFRSRISRKRTLRQCACRIPIRHGGCGRSCRTKAKP